MSYAANPAATTRAPFLLRIPFGFVAFILGAVATFMFGDRIIEIVFAPLCQGLRAGNSQAECQLIYSAPLERFTLMIELAMLGGAILALPCIFHQIARNTARRMMHRSERLIVPHSLATLPLALLGAVIAIFVHAPALTARFSRYLDTFFQGEVASFFMSEYLSYAVGLAGVYAVLTLVPNVALLIWRSRRLPPVPDTKEWDVFE
ncbi:twin-arginine translocase subunit TatC [Roseovarius sp. SCSIO 43702]|uniref:twin-arginine translocase subunit TatC n=1 Tax=Roseovarius sp. SCSIO 43702 TaxID=2823043 RepID=UPI001C732E91|nr:twin-arginine translocase subunit TatC [Roseovarius sp. SCSIO 43702]QYX55410.1 twin-arginine translocase subunit TatC [Roseovarius sp. SCSIO 43702]